MVEYDYSKLLGRMKEKHFTQAELAESIGLSETSLNFRLNNKLDFKQQDMRKIADLLEIDPADLASYFFCRSTLEI